MLFCKYYAFQLININNYCLSKLFIIEFSISYNKKIKLALKMLYVWALASLQHLAILIFLFLEILNYIMQFT